MLSIINEVLCPVIWSEFCLVRFDIAVVVIRVFKSISTSIPINKSTCMLICGIFGNSGQMYFIEVVAICKISVFG